MKVSLLCVLFGHRFGEWSRAVLWLKFRQCKRCEWLDLRDVPKEEA